MCGIAGLLDLSGRGSFEPLLLERMLSLISHRGPGGRGAYRDGSLWMGSVRLPMIDVEAGRQPMSNEEGSVWVVFNGEVYNYVELTAELKARGHVFRTACDTEVIVHLYEELGVECLRRLNGQFAFALWDARTSELFLARDRVGICPLFYARTAGALAFASEIKALFAHPGVVPRLDPLSLDQIFTFWTPLTPRTAFQGVYELPPGHFMVVRGGRLNISPYWRLTFPLSGDAGGRRVEDAVEEFRALLEDAVRLRLRSDVPVGAYLSGGIDSCAVAALVRRQTQGDLRTFSVGFPDREFDETAHQREAAQYLGTGHTSVVCSCADIGRVFPDAVWHAETPVLRTAPAPMYLLSGLVRESGIQAVMTGEGADEMLAGYSIFKEALVRQFWARRPDSRVRPLLLQRLYPYLPQIQGADVRALRLFFAYDLANTSDPVYSHALRWHNTARIKQFFSRALRDWIGEYDPVEEVRGRVEAGLQGWPLLSRAQYLEATMFMSGYLLSSQGDRMTMAHSVEGRYPFLDHRLIEFCAGLPPAFKLRGLTEKVLLKRAMRGQIPDAILRRPKQPYRAPVAGCFLGPDSPDYVQDLLSMAAIEAVGVFAPGAVARLLSKARSDRSLSETEGMALTGILSTQLVHRLFVQGAGQPSVRAVRPVPCVVRGDGKLSVAA
ncbi:asparagine synthase (glutamine-hydrolyzing) [bacterium]|nr:asparagine synthase (glutamine-hydrolyzing) [bacterium]